MLQKKYVYDLLTRILHAGIGGSLLLLLITAKLAKVFYENSSVRHNLWMLHIYLGFILTSFLILRFVWFFFGPQYARISNFIQLSNWKEIVRTRKVKWEWGHHPFAGIAYLGVYGIIIFIIYTGHFLSRIQHDVGPISPKYFDDMNLFVNFIEGHELASLLIIVFTLIHLIALLWHQQNDGVSIISSMVDGYQHKQTDINEKEYGDAHEDA